MHGRKGISSGQLAALQAKREIGGAIGANNNIAAPQQCLMFCEIR